MIRILFGAVCLVAAAAAGYVSYPEEFKQYLSMAIGGLRWTWDSIQANPVPVSLAAGTFLLTVIYHKAKGKSLRESVEVAATRVTVVPVAMPQTADENLVVKRAKARAMRAQLLADQNGIQNRHRKLPEEVLKAEKDACYTEQTLVDAQRKLADKQKLHEEAVTKLEALRKEKAQSEAELFEIELELERLAQTV
jgi:hypothetical protein